MPATPSEEGPGVGLSFGSDAVGTWHYLPGTDQMHWSPAASRVLAAGPTRVTEPLDRLRDRVHGEDLEACDALIASIRAGRTAAVRLRIRGPDGDVRVVRLHCEGAACGVLGISGAVQDLTAQARREGILAARAALQGFQGSEQTDEVLRAAVDAIERLTGSEIGFFVLLDPERPRVALQACSSRTLGRVPAEFASARHSDADGSSRWSECVRTKKAAFLELGGGRRNGFPVGHPSLHRALFVPVVRSDRVVGTVAVGNKPGAYTEEDAALAGELADDAWEIASHAEHRRKRRELEQRAEQRREIERLGILAGGIAHLMNNLTTAIVGNVELALMDDSALEATRTCLGHVLEAAQRISALTGQMSLYAGRVRPRPSPIDVDPWTRDLLDEIEKDPRPRTRLLKDLACRARVLADEAQLRHALEQVLRNALESAREGGTVSVRTEVSRLESDDLARSLIGPAGPPGRYVTWTIRDDNAATDENALRGAFDPFAARCSPDRGLGLPSVLGILRQHCGVLFARSPQGRGTEIRLGVPLGGMPSGSGREPAQDLGPSR
ncbi:MAG: hypothetical protein Fur0037_11880 [Planctomycetota bacterium]